GSEIVMAFDECLPGNVGFEETRRSVELTTRWAARSKNRFEEIQSADLSPFTDTQQAEACSLNGLQALFGIIQGAGHFELRKKSLDRTVEISFDGYAIGGLSVGEEKSVMYEVLEFLAPQMPTEAPRYLMGVGTPEDLLEAVSHGIDMFDCVLPTRNGRTGSAFTSNGNINIRNARFRVDESPLDPLCGCSVCNRYSRAYLRHLYHSGEMLAAILISHHNLAFFLDTMRQVRQAIGLGSFAEFKKQFLANRKQEAD
ncbi:MAG TPA: tRNA guanosine(34) transglycosylase Tgt, partial [Pyrinomonadaceae bacterium]|nr:tRNA guanosine(34) transglycosylase Tgt [Pyrinomonadaceae bacterium]